MTIIHDIESAIDTHERCAAILFRLKWRAKYPARKMRGQEIQKRMIALLLSEYSNKLNTIAQ